MKIGDKVKVKTNKVNIPLDYQGSEGVIVKINEKDISSCEKQEYWICIKDVLGDRWFCEDELEIIK